METCAAIWGNHHWKDDIWYADNSAGSRPFSENVKYTHGVSVTNSQSFRKREAFSVALETSVGLAKGPLSASASVRTELQTEVETTTASEETNSWSETREITFTAPAGKKYKVNQFVCSAESLLDSDNCIISGSLKIYEEWLCHRWTFRLRLWSSYGPRRMHHYAFQSFPSCPISYTYSKNELCTSLGLLFKQQNYIWQIDVI